MSNIVYAIGTESNKYFTTSRLISSQDGLSWTNNDSEIFPVHANPQTLIATETTILAFNSLGEVAKTVTQGQSWQIYQIAAGFLPQSAITVNATYYVCGIYKYQTATGSFAQWDEVARIYSSTDGVVWTMEFSHSITNSIFYQIKNNGNDLYVAGAVNNKISCWTNASNVWEPMDLGELGPAYGLTINSVAEKIWFSGAGYILKFDINTSQYQINWIANKTIPITNVERKTNIDNINYDLDPSLVATSHLAIYSTSDGVNWTSFQVPGYYFKDIVWFNNSWIVSAISNQTIVTYWRSTDGKTWEPQNNQIQITGFSAFSQTPPTGIAQLDYSDQDALIWNWWERNI